MSSALPTDPVAGRAAANSLAASITRTTSAAHMSPRQLELDRRYAYFRGSIYDGRAFDWNGDPLPFDSSGVARQRDIPPGYTDTYGNTAPLKQRRPSAPYYLAKVVTKRFTGMLFSHRRHPKARVPGDPASTDWLAAAADAGRLWAQMIEARDLGGSTGSVAVGFEIHDGRPLFEVFDPRFCTPTFKNRLTRELLSLEVKWTYTEWAQDIDGKYVEALMWARRVIDENTDTMWSGVLVDPDGHEPDWTKLQPSSAVAHGLGECPVEWVQNRPVSNEVDGDSDCHGAYDLIEQIDVLQSQAIRGIVAACAPTLQVSTDDEMPEVSLGVDTFVRLNQGDAAKYLEINGAGPKSAMDQADALEEKALRLVQCVLDQARSATSKTATEVDRDYSSFYEACDVLREQYGQALQRLLAKLMRAAKKLGAGVVLPPRLETGTDGKQKLVARKLGPRAGEEVAFQWPGYTTPTVDDAQKAVQAAMSAKESSLIDEEHASQFIAQVFQVEDVRAMLAGIRRAKEEEEARYAAQTVGEATAPAQEMEPAKFVQFEVEAGIVTVNELRASKGLPPLGADGDLTVPQYRAKYAPVFAQSTMSINEAGAEKVLGMSDESEPEPTPPGLQ
jgi:hypothetical protein